MLAQDLTPPIIPVGLLPQCSPSSTVTSHHFVSHHPYPHPQFKLLPTASSSDDELNMYSDECSSTCSTPSAGVGTVGCGEGQYVSSSSSSSASPIGPFSLVPPAPPHSSRHNDTTSPPVAAAAATTAPTPRVSVPDCGGFDSLIGLRREKLALASTVLLPYARARRWAEDEADADADAERQSSSSSPLLTPSFILLYGPPGVGKTALVTALAHECNLPLHAIRASDVYGGIVGESEGNVRRVFEGAMKGNEGGSVVFIDEIDCFVTSRGGGGGGRGGGEGGGGGATSGNNCDRRVLSELLQNVSEISAFNRSSGGRNMITIVGATNRVGDIDEALVRRFPTRILVSLPSWSTRLSMLRSFTSDSSGGFGGSLDDVLNPAEWASLEGMTEGMSGSDLRAVSDAAKIRPSVEKMEGVMRKRERESAKSGVDRGKRKRLIDFVVEGFGGGSDKGGGGVRKIEVGDFVEAVENFKCGRVGEVDEKEKEKETAVTRMDTIAQTETRNGGGPRRESWSIKMPKIPTLGTKSMSKTKNKRKAAAQSS